jgi:hypothetical protein
MHFNIPWYILFTIFSPTYFGRYSDRLQGDVLITRIQLLLTVSPSLHKNYNDIIWLKLLK